MGDLDPRSIGLSFALCILLLSIVLATSRRDERTPGVDWLVAASVFGGLGLGVSALGPTQHEFIGLTLGDTFVFWSGAFAIVGLRTLRRVENQANLALFAALLVFVFNVVCVHIVPEPQLRVSANSFLIAVASFLCALEYLRLTRRQSIQAIYFGAFPCLAFGIFMAARGISVALIPETKLAADWSAMGVFFYLVGSLAFTATVIAMLMVVNAIRANRVRRLAYRDALTNALSRRGLYSILENWLIRQPLGATVAVLDIDHFKAVNDHCGHDMGDQLLRLLAEVCQRCVHEDALVARLGGDEFVLLLPVDTSVEQTCDEIQNIFERKRLRLDRVVANEAYRSYVEKSGVSIGAAMIRGKSIADFNAAMREAETEMYAQKELRRSPMMSAKPA